MFLLKKKINLSNPSIFLFLLHFTIFSLWILLPSSYFLNTTVSVNKFFSLYSMFIYLFLIFIFLYFINFGDKKLKFRFPHIYIKKNAFLIVFFISIFLNLLMFFLFLFELNNKTNGKLLSFAFSLNFFELFSLIGTLNINTPYFFIFNYNLFILYFVAKSVYKLKIPVIVLFLILVAPFFRAIFLGERNSVIYLLFIYLIFLGFQNNKPPLLKVLIIGILSVLIFLVIQVFRLGISNITENFTDLFQSFLNYFLMPFNYSQYIISNINTFTFPGQTLYFLNGFFSNFHIYENQLELFISARNVILYQNIYSNPSFNNISFIGELIIEFNILTPFILMIYGLIIGVFYKNFRNLNLFSTMIYPFLFIAVFESGRINFFFNTNFIFGILYSVLTLFIMKLLSKRI